MNQPCYRPSPKAIPRSPRRLALPVVITVLLAAGCAINPVDTLQAVPDDSQVVLVTPSIQNLWDGLDQLLGELHAVDPALTEELLLYLDDLLALLPEPERAREIESLQEVHDTGIDVTRTTTLSLSYSMGLDGLHASYLLGVPIHDPLRLRGFIREILGPDFRRGEEVEIHLEHSLKETQSGLFMHYSDGLLLISDRLETLRSGIDARVHAEERFFTDEDQLELGRRMADCQLCLHVAPGRFANLARPVISGLGLPALLADYLERTRGLALGLRIRPEGLSLRGGALLDGGLEVAPPCSPANSPESLLYAELPLPGGKLGAVLEWVELTFFGDGREEPTDLGLREFGESLVRGLRFNLYDAGSFPAGYIAVELVDPERSLEAYEAAVRPRIVKLLDLYLSRAALLRSEGEGEVVDVFAIEALDRIKQYPALAFLEDDLVFTSQLADLTRIAGLLGPDHQPALPEDFSLIDEKLLDIPTEDGCARRPLLYCSVDRLTELLAATPLIKVHPLVRSLSDHYQLGGAVLLTEDDFIGSELLLCTRGHHPEASLPVTEVDTPWPWWLWLSIGALVCLPALVLLIVHLIRRRRHKRS